jgi:hypothetical protein
MWLDHEGSSEKGYLVVVDAQGLLHNTSLVSEDYSDPGGIYPFGTNRPSLSRMQDMIG